jgi:hypothetical protein
MHISILMDRWYIGLFLVGFGLVVILRAGAMHDLRRAFTQEERTPELDAAIARRQVLEATPLAVWYVPGAINVLLGIAVLSGKLHGIVGYGFGACALAVSLGTTYLRMRNRGATRAAALAPRTLTSIVPLVWYPAAAIVSVAPLAFINVAGYAMASVLVSAATMAIFGFAVASNSMASIMSGENPQEELQVDQRLRCARVFGLFGAGMGVPFVFVSMVSPIAPSSILHTTVYLLVVLAWCALVIPLLMRRVRLPI